jgi:protein-disulfide isomerase
MRRNILSIFGFALVMALVGVGQARAEAAKDDPAAEMFVGKADAPITMYAYVSLVCPHCADWEAETLPKLKKDYVDKGLLKIVYREFPGTADQPWPRVPAMMARCLGREEYPTMIALLFKDQDKWTDAKTGQEFLDKVFAYGRLAGMSKEQFDACIKNQKVLDAMADRWREGEKAGLEGTPFFVVGDKHIEGARPYDDFKAVLDPMAAKVGKDKK